MATRLEQGKPEQVIERARDNPTEHPPRGPTSVGHTARFVLGHAPCDVLLLRQ